MCFDLLKEHVSLWEAALFQTVLREYSWRQCGNIQISILFFSVVIGGLFLLSIADDLLVPDLAVFTESPVKLDRVCPGLTCLPDNCIRCRNFLAASLSTRVESYVSFCVGFSAVEKNFLRSEIKKPVRIPVPNNRIKVLIHKIFPENREVPDGFFLYKSEKS